MGMQVLNELRKAIQSREGLRYSQELREQIESYVRESRQQGKSWNGLSEELGIPSCTLTRWCEESPGGLVPVRVATPETMTLVSPGGWRIEGLSLQTVRSLLKEMRG